MTSWKTLTHHAGSAVQVPKWVEQLVLGGDAHKPTIELDEALVQPGVWCSASAPTLELLFNQLASARCPEWILSVIAEILGNDQARGWLEGMASAPSDVLEVVTEHRDKLWQALRSADPIVRSAAGFCASVVSESLRPEAAAQVTEAGLREGDPVASSSFLLALGALTSGRDEAFAHIERSLGDRSPEVRGAAALAKVRAVPTLKLEEVQAELADWLRRTIESNSESFTSRPGFFWFTRYSAPGGAFRWLLRRSGVALGLLLRQGRCPEAWVESLVSFGEASEDGLVTRAISDALTVAFELDRFDPQWTVPPEHLSEAQRRLAHRLADTRLIARAGYGFSSSGAVRRRWLGLVPPGPLERVVDYEVRGEAKQGPLYRAWQACAGAGWNNPLPRPLENLSGAERWQAVAEFLCAAYSSTSKGIKSALLEREIELATKATDLPAIASGVLDDCAERVRRSIVEQQPIGIDAQLSTLLLLPAAAAHLPWNPRWEVLLSADAAPWKRLASVLPKGDLDDWLWNNQQKQKFELHYVELLPTSRHPKRSLYTIHNARKAGKAVPQVSLELERRIHELGKTVPHFAEAVKEFEAETAS